jgi:hypothetical protein
MIDVLMSARGDRMRRTYITQLRAKLPPWRCWAITLAIGVCVLIGGLLIWFRPAAASSPSPFPAAPTDTQHAVPGDDLYYYWSQDQAPQALPAP